MGLGTLLDTSAPSAMLTSPTMIGRVTRGPVAAVLATVVVAMTLAACGGSRRVAPAPASVLTTAPGPESFTQVSRAVDRTYTTSPDLTAFTAQDVQYTRTSSSKVLTVCHQGGGESNKATLETARVLACAPLIFYFYSYGRREHSSSAFATARALYWYGSQIGGPFNPRPTLTTLLRGWGVK